MPVITLSLLLISLVFFNCSIASSFKAPITLEATPFLWSTSAWHNFPPHPTWFHHFYLYILNSLWCWRCTCPSSLHYHTETEIKLYINSRIMHIVEVCRNSTISCIYIYIYILRKWPWLTVMDYRLQRLIVRPDCEAFLQERLWQFPFQFTLS